MTRLGEPKTSNPVSPEYGSRGYSILLNLQKQLLPLAARDPQELSSESNISVSAPRTRENTPILAKEIRDYAFDVGETPFNCPLNRPLGDFILFRAERLSPCEYLALLQFNTPQPITEEIRPEIGKGDVEIHLRCLLVELDKPKSEWKQAWPYPATCCVNGYDVTLNQSQRYSNGKLSGRDSATDITPFLRELDESRSEPMKNRVTLRQQRSATTAGTGQFVLFAQEVLVLGSRTMQNSVYEASEKYWMRCIAHLREEPMTLSANGKFELDTERVRRHFTGLDGVMVSSMRVSLRCPLGLTRISSPVKGEQCKHLQCFDLECFLEFARRSAKFNCPVCGRNISFPEKLLISPYIERALTLFDKDDEININPDGSMTEVPREQSGVASHMGESVFTLRGGQKLVEISERANPKGFDVVNLVTDNKQQKVGGTGRSRSLDVLDLTVETEDERKQP